MVYRSGSFLTGLRRFTEWLSLRQHQFEVRRPMLDFAFCELAVGGAQALYFPLCSFRLPLVGFIP